MGGGKKGEGGNILNSEFGMRKWEEQGQRAERERGFRFQESGRKQSK